MWKRLEGELGCGATNYVCGCGPNATPGRRCLSEHAFRIAEGGPVGEFDGM